MVGQERISRGGCTDGRCLGLRVANEDKNGHARARIPLKKNLYEGVRWHVLKCCIKVAGGSIAEHHPHACVRTAFSKVVAAA
jgi:hypothetical protein